MEIETRKEGNKLIVSPVGRIDSLTADEFESKVRAELTPEIAELLIDMKDVDFVSSKGIRILLMFHRDMMRNGKLTISNINNAVREVLRLSALLNQFNII